MKSKFKTHRHMYIQKREKRERERAQEGAQERASHNLHTLYSFLHSGTQTQDFEQARQSLPLICIPIPKKSYF